MMRTSGSATGGFLSARLVLVLTIVGAAFALSAGPGSATGGPPPPAPPATPLLPTPVRDNGAGDWFRHVCAAPDGAAAGCGAQVVSNAAGTPLASTSPPASAYGPTQFHTAYNLPTGPSTQTIGIVDAFDDPSIESDLAAYDTKYGLPACTTANGCFRKVNETGGTSYPAGNSWHLEIALDVETAHEICQTCKILLVEATTNSLADLGQSVNEAVALGASVVSNSYGAGEYSGETTDENTYFKHPGVAITASTGDGGYGVEFPAASQYVTAVGGTTLKLNANNTYASESVWGGAGSGCSKYEPKPAWQTDTGCAKRTVGDVAADADPNTGAAVYDSVGTTGGAAWYQVGGTSLASPLIAAVYALAGNSGVNYGSTPYSHAGSLHDVASGSNGNCGGSYLCTGKAGYDGPTGLGTPNGVAAFTTAAPAPTFTLGVTPSTATVNAGQTATYTVSVNDQNGFSGSVALTASGLPTGASATFTPTSTSTTSVLTVTTTAGTTPAGTSTLTIGGTSGTLSASTTATLVVQAPSFSLGVSPSSATVTSGSTATYTVSVNNQNGFSGSVALTASGLPTGASATFTPTSTSTTSVLTVTTTAATTPAGTSTLTIGGTSGTLSASATATLVVQVPSFSLGVSPSSATVTSGSTATYTVAVTDHNGFSGSVALTASGLPTGASATFTPTPTSTTSVLTVTTAATTPAATSTLTITGTSGALTASTTATLVVQAPVVGPSVTVSTSSAPRGSVVTVSWANVSSPSTTDWIGIYVHGAANTSYLNWIYTSSCNQHATSPARSSGSCSFTLPATAGTYEFRLLSNNGYTLLATSSLVTTT